MARAWLALAEMSIPIDDRFALRDLWRDPIGDRVCCRETFSTAMQLESAGVGRALRVGRLCDLCRDRACRPDAPPANCRLERRRKKVARIAVIFLVALNWIYLLANWRQF